MTTAARAISGMVALAAEAVWYQGERVDGRRLRAVHQLFPCSPSGPHLSGGLLSGGQQQMLAVGRALLAAPDLVIFDEISLGLAPVVDRLYQALATVNRRGVAMLVIEQNVERGLALVHRAYVLEKGRVALHGPPATIRTDPRLLALYVGQTSG